MTTHEVMQRIEFENYKLQLILHGADARKAMALEFPEPGPAGSAKRIGPTPSEIRALGFKYERKPKPGGQPDGK